jgi:cytochrome c biogenesis protein CcdA
VPVFAEMLVLFSDTNAMIAGLLLLIKALIGIALIFGAICVFLGPLIEMSFANLFSNDSFFDDDPDAF